MDIIGVPLTMDISSAKPFASDKLPTQLSVDQMIMIAYVQQKKTVVMHTGRIEKVWKYPTHYEVKVAFMPRNETCFETLYFQDFNNWESPNAWSVIKSPVIPQQRRWECSWLLSFILCIGLAIVTVALMHGEIFIDYVRYG